MKKIILLLFLGSLFVSCKTETIGAVLNQGSQILLNPNGQPSQSEINLGLKEALSVSIEKGAKSLAQKNGYYGSSLVRLALPDEVKQIESSLRKLGLGSLTDELTVKLNRAAEDAALKSVPIFKKAILQMSFKDVMGVLTGPQDAATSYLKKSTSSDILKAFQVPVTESLQKVGAVTLWKEIFTKYNSIPFVKKVNTDLVGYTSEKALKGLFLNVSKRESEIRKDVNSRTSPLLQKVFGYAASL